MANYEGHARSNYVKLDPKKMDALGYLFPISFHTREEDGRTCIMSDDEFGTPGCELFDDADLWHALETLTGDDKWSGGDRVEFLDVVHHAFADDPEDGLFVWMEVGFEKLRYLTGFATAIDETGEVVNQVSLSDIYDMEGVLTRAEY